MPKTQTKSQATRPSIRAIPFEIASGRSRPLFVPHRSRHVPETAWRPYPGPTLHDWQQMAEQKGFRIHSRVRDRLHFALECKTCGALSAHKLFSLRTAQPRCGGCAEAGHISQAEAAGLIFLHRREKDRHYATYRARCGHNVHRQFGFIERVAAGLTDINCERCQVQREKAEAKRQGWRRKSRDPKGNPNYRIYRHHCGHEQRIARVNMAWGQCKCAACGTAWNARASYIYMLRIEVPEANLHVLKLGFSRTPVKRYRHQLGLPPSARVELIRTLPMRTGNEACTAEKAAHAELARSLPEAVVPMSVYADVLNVVSEIYAPTAYSAIMTAMDRIEARATPGKTV
jgi:hypothetical protein